MGTEPDDHGRYVIVCDTCGTGFPTLSHDQRSAMWLAGMAGWSIDIPAGPEICPGCAARITEYQEDHP